MGSPILSCLTAAGMVVAKWLGNSWVLLGRKGHSSASPRESHGIQNGAHCRLYCCQLYCWWRIEHCRLYCWWRIEQPHARVPDLRQAVGPDGGNHCQVTPSCGPAPPLSLLVPLPSRLSPITNRLTGAPVVLSTTLGPGTKLALPQHKQCGVMHMLDGTFATL